MLIRAIKDTMQNEYGSVYGIQLRVFPPIEKEEALKIFQEWAKDRVSSPTFLTEKQLQEYYDTQDQYNADVWDQLSIEHYESFKDALADYLREYGIEVNHLTSDEERTIVEALRFIKENDYDVYCWISGLIKAFRGNISQINYLKSLQEEKKNPISNRRKRGR